MINTDPQHIHKYDSNGKMVCCYLEEKVYAQAGAADLIADKMQVVAQEERFLLLRKYGPASISLLLLMTGLALDFFIKPAFFSVHFRLILYLIAYIPVAVPVIKDAVKALGKGEVFTEFTLMLLATIGAFSINEYPEAVAVMLFYSVGELFQSAAVNRAKRSIRALLDVRPKMALVMRNDKPYEVRPEDVMVNEVIQVKAGERIALDGVLLTESGNFNTSALTGESAPRAFKKGEQVLAGMINLDKVVEVKVTRAFKDSSISRILDLVQNANSKKAPTELFIRKFSKVYTPIVVGLAVAVAFLPYFFVNNYVFREWLYRSLIFLVISCPCALVIAIPLGYFGGIGAASRKGILIKGSTYLDLLTKVNTVVMDKTGTLTKGVFTVQQVKTSGMDEAKFISTVAAIEAQSTHPIAKAITEFGKDYHRLPASDITEISGHGLQGKVDGNEVMVGNAQLLKRNGISYPADIDTITDTIVIATINKKYSGYITISDQLKEDAIKAVEYLNNLKIESVMLSGDKQTVVDQIGRKVGIKKAFGNLLPENKVQKVEEIKKDASRIVVFVGDGINDAPVLAASDVGIAMGGLGSEAAIETADMVIQTDQPSKVYTAIKISKVTKAIVWQNILLAFGVKLLVLALGAGGMATMWEAVFADVGVALLAILNAVRIQNQTF